MSSFGTFISLEELETIFSFKGVEQMWQQRCLFVLFLHLHLYCYAGLNFSTAICFILFVLVDLCHMNEAGPSSFLTAVSRNPWFLQRHPTHPNAISLSDNNYVTCSINVYYPSIATISPVFIRCWCCMQSISRAGPGHRQYRQMLGAPSATGALQTGEEKMIILKKTKKKKLK